MPAESGIAPASAAAEGFRRPTVAVAAHLYYTDLWPELAAMIRQVPEPYALFVTIPQASAAESTVLADFPQALVRRVPNLGRDVGPFVWLLPELLAFDLACKLHSKRNIPLYRSWRIEALRGVLGGTGLVERILDAFATHPDLMLAGSGALFIDGFRHIYRSERRLRAFQPEFPERFGFFAGTMFWTRPQLFTDFAEAFPFTYFVPHGDGDGQLEHVIERMFGVRPASLGGSVGLTRIVDGLPEVEIVPATTPRVSDFTKLLEGTLVDRYQDYPLGWQMRQALIGAAPLGLPDGFAA